MWFCRVVLVHLPWEARVGPHMYMYIDLLSGIISMFLSCNLYNSLQPDCHDLFGSESRVLCSVCVDEKFCASRGVRAEVCLGFGRGFRDPFRVQGVRGLGVRGLGV